MRCFCLKNHISLKSEIYIKFSSIKFKIIAKFSKPQSIKFKIRFEFSKISVLNLKKFTLKFHLSKDTFKKMH